MRRASAGEPPKGEGGPEEAREWAHVRLFPLTYDQLELQQDAADQSTEESAGGPSILWRHAASA